MLGHVRIGGGRAQPREGDKYRGAYYHETFARKRKIASFAERYERDLAVGRMRVAELARRTPLARATFLDVGCGAGPLVVAALEAGCDAYGIDPGDALISWAVDRDEHLRRRLIATARIPYRAGGGWSVVACCDVLEHLSNAYEKLGEIRDAMVPGGLLVIEEPDPTSEQARAEGANWRHIKPFEHVFLPSPQTWGDILVAAGFVVHEIVTPVPGKVAIYARKK